VPEIAAGKLANPIETQSMLADISSWASILSLVLTFVNTYLIIRIRAGIVVNLTLEPILDRLRKNSSEMNQSLSYYEIHSTNSLKPLVSARQTFELYVVVWGISEGDFAPICCGQ
jgi:hypothetical protein